MVVESIIHHINFFVFPESLSTPDIFTVKLWFSQLFVNSTFFVGEISFVQQLQPMSGRCSLFRGIEQLYISPQYTTTCVSIQFLARWIILLVRPWQMLGLTPIWVMTTPGELCCSQEPLVAICLLWWVFLKTFCVFKIDLVAGLYVYIVSLFDCISIVSFKDPVLLSHLYLEGTMPVFFIFLSMSMLLSVIGVFILFSLLPTPVAYFHCPALFSSVKKITSFCTVFPSWVLRTSLPYTADMISYISEIQFYFEILFFGIVQARVYYSAPQFFYLCPVVLSSWLVREDHGLLTCTRLSLLDKVWVHWLLPRIIREHRILYLWLKIFFFFFNTSSL